MNTKFPLWRVCVDTEGKGDEASLTRTDDVGTRRIESGEEMVGDKHGLSGGGRDQANQRQEEV